MREINVHTVAEWKVAKQVFKATNPQATFVNWKATINSPAMTFCYRERDSEALACLVLSKGLDFPPNTHAN